MLTPVQCPTCGMMTGDISDIYDHLRAERSATILAEADILPSKAALGGVEIPTGDILDELGVTEICCRTTLMTAMKFLDLY